VDFDQYLEIQFDYEEHLLGKDGEIPKFARQNFTLDEAAEILGIASAAPSANWGR
jgi:hypothetical protein